MMSFPIPPTPQHSPVSNRDTELCLQLSCHIWTYNSTMAWLLGFGWRRSAPTSEFCALVITRKICAPTCQAILLTLNSDTCHKNENRLLWKRQQIWHNWKPAVPGLSSQRTQMKAYLHSHSKYDSPWQSPLCWGFGGSLRRCFTSTCNQPGHSSGLISAALCCATNSIVLFGLLSQLQRWLPQRSADLTISWSGFCSCCLWRLNSAALPSAVLTCWGSDLCWFTSYVGATSAFCLDQRQEASPVLLLRFWFTAEVNNVALFFFSVH